MCARVGGAGVDVVKQLAVEDLAKFLLDSLQPPVPRKRHAPRRRTLTPRKSLHTPRGHQRGGVKEESSRTHTQRETSPWGVRVKRDGEKVAVSVPAHVTNGESVVQSMVRRYLQRKCLLGTLQLTIPPSGGILLLTLRQKEAEPTCNYIHMVVIVHLCQDDEQPNFGTSALLAEHQGDRMAMQAPCPPEASEPGTAP